nr:HipA domain-containing protein [Ferrimicrobium acidiphilum]
MVLFDGRHVATLYERGRQMTMVYTDEAGPLDAPLVSMAMPVGSRRYDNQHARAFFRGLLPEGEARRMLAYDFRLDESDDMGLLAVLGRDCAGALVIRPGDSASRPSTNTVVPKAIDNSEVARRLRELPMHPLGVDQEIRVSLAGVQAKLLLTKLDSGHWGLPGDNVVSTHILKLAHRDLLDSVTNEAFCINLAARAGILAAHTTIATFAGSAVLVSERYDRRRVDGVLQRIHQEDACQALSVLTVVPEHKYEEFGGPTLAKIAGLLDLWGDAQSKEELLRQVAFHLVVGNADAHGKNVSFLHNNDGSVGLAPIYDVMSTEYYAAAYARPMSSTLGLFVNAKRNINDVTVEDLVAEAKRWGMRRMLAEQVIHQLLDRLPDAIEQAVNDIPSVPEALVDLIRARLHKIRTQAVRSDQAIAEQITRSSVDASEDERGTGRRRHHF